MKILLVVHCFFPHHIYGTETYTLNLAKNLQSLGREVVVLSAVFPGEPRCDQLVSRYEYQGVSVICVDRNHLPSDSLETSFDLPDLEPVLAEILNQERPDIIHINHLMNHTAALPRVARRLGIPMVATLTDFHPFCFNGRLQDANSNLCSGPDRIASNCLDCLRREASNFPWAVELTPGHSIGGGAETGLLSPLPSGGSREADLQRALLKRKERLLAVYSEFEFVITPTAFLENAFRRLVPDWKYHRLHFGVDVDRSTKPPRPVGAPLTIGFVGQMTEHKGPDLLIDAIRQLSPIQNFRARVYGSEQQDPVFASRLRKSALGLPVEFCGVFPAEEIATVLREIDVLVIPSRWHENSPLVLLYALATHTPVIVSAAEGMTEFLNEGKNGYSFAIGDSRQLAAQLRRFIIDPTLAARLSLTTFYELTTIRMAAHVDTLYLNLPTTNHP